MLTGLQWKLRSLSRRLWFRASLFAMLGVVTPFLALLFGPLIPPGVPTEVGVQAVDRVLGIIASSMLAVSTFSLATMVTAFSAATSNATPRATRLLVEDPSTQNALAAFIGSFLFSLVGIITLSAKLYDPRGQLVLFLVTIIVIAMVVILLLRWIDQLARMGRVGETIDRVELTAKNAMRDWVTQPFRGGRPLEGGAIPEGAHALYADTIGYVQNVDMHALSNACDAEDHRIYITVLPGAFVHNLTPLVRLEGHYSRDRLKTIRSAFAIANHRSFDQDPRFGLVVLSEIASRALSPGINDPGTAIQVVSVAVRLLSLRIAASAKPEEEDDQTPFPNIFVPEIRSDEMFDDVFTPIARDGAGIIEVGIALQKAFGALAASGDDAYESSARKHSALALERARAALAVEADVTRLEAHAARV